MGRFPNACATAMALGLACTSPLHSGSFGTFRYVGQVKGAPPLQMVPPISDRNGNIYSLYGAVDTPEALAFVSRFAGGSSAACAVTKGDAFGVHGFVGFADDRVWYWSGDALAVVTENAACQAILDTDPSSGSNVAFRAVVPWVTVKPLAHPTLVALIQSPGDAAPSSALIDLEIGLATNLGTFAPADATDVKILGVGADPKTAEGFVLLEYTRGMAVTIEGRFYDGGANLEAAARVTGAPLDDYAVVGALEITTSGRVVGLTKTKSVVAFDRSGGAMTPVDASIAPVGVHKWNDALWLVGTSNGQPVVAPIDPSGAVGAATPWTASVHAAAALTGPLTLTDDRSIPARSTTWQSVSTAVGDFPFLSARSLWPHAPDTTLWMVAGPGYDAGGFRKTAFAVAPSGISYP